MQRPARRRLPSEPDSAGLDWAKTIDTSSPEQLLRIQGLPSTLFEGPDFDPEDHLIPWLGDQSTLVDRFDGRLLLETLLPRRDSALQLPDGAEEPSEADLNNERYADLDYSREPELASIAGWYNPAAEATQGDEESDYHGSGANLQPLSTVRRVYGPPMEQESADPQPMKAESLLPTEPEDPFVAPFAVPSGLATPETQRQHKIIAQTAKFVREAGKQSVFVLRVKQANNPNFTFLMPHDSLHPYFNWLMDTDPKESKEAEDGSASEAHNDAEKNALGLLSSYGSEGSETPMKADQSPSAGGSRVSPFLSGSTGGEPAAHADSSHGDSNEPTDSTSIQLPPADVQAIIGKLVEFVQKYGDKFEASVRQREKDNSRFGFLFPEHKYHEFYRQEMVRALGREHAADVLPKASASTVFQMPFPRPCKDLAKPHASTTQSAIGLQSQTASPKVGAIRANPSVVSLAFGPIAEEQAASRKTAKQTQARLDPLGRVSSDASQLRSQHLKAKSAGKHSDKSAGKDAAKRVPGSPEEEKAVSVLGTGSFGVSDSDHEFLRATAGPAPTGKASQAPAAELAEVDEAELLEAEAKASAVQRSSKLKEDEDKKAQRRRLARELLLSKQAKLKGQPDKERSKLVNNIVQHRSAFLSEEEDPAAGLPPGARPANAEPGEVLPASATQNAQRHAHLPKLEDLLHAKRSQPTSDLSGFEVIAHSHEKDKKRGKASGSKRRHDSPTRPHRKSKKSSRSRRERSSSSDSDRAYKKRSHPKRRSRSPNSSRKGKERTRSPNALPEKSRSEAVYSPEELKERVRAMLRAQQ